MATEEWDMMWKRRPHDDLPPIGKAVWGVVEHLGYRFVVGVVRKFQDPTGFIGVRAQWHLLSNGRPVNGIVTDWCEIVPPKMPRRRTKRRDA